MDNMENILSLLGLAKKAGRLEVGEEPVGSAARAHDARLILLASDAADNARRRAENLVNGRRTLLLELPFDRAELGGALGLGACAMAAVTDLGFAGKLTELLAGIDPARFAEAAAETARRSEKAQRRKRETEAMKRKQNNNH